MIDISTQCDAGDYTRLGKDAVINYADCPVDNYCPFGAKQATPCHSGSSTWGEKNKNTQYNCKCKVGYYENYRKLALNAGVYPCDPCPDGGTCDGQTIQPKSKKGYAPYNNKDGISFYECSPSIACKEGVSSKVLEVPQLQMNCTADKVVMFTNQNYGYCPGAEKYGCNYNPSANNVNSGGNWPQCSSSMPKNAICICNWADLSMLDNQICTKGYSSSSSDTPCNSCLRSTEKYFRSNGTCEKCPATNWPLICIIALSVLVGGGLMFYGFTKLNLDFKLFVMSITFLQTLSSFREIPLSWSKPIKVYLDIVSSTNINVELANPECVVPLTFTQKWMFIQV